MNRKNRKTSRKNRKTSRRNRRMYGGFNAPLGNDPMLNLQQESLRQGDDFLTHRTQGGGGLQGVEYGQAYTGTPLLSSDMAASARTAVLDQAMSEISGMRDQSGGRRRKARKSKKTKKTKKTRGGANCMLKGGAYGMLKGGGGCGILRGGAKKSRKGKGKGKKHTSRKHRGGAFTGAPVGNPGMILSGDLASRATSGMSSEWETLV